MTHEEILQADVLYKITPLAKELCELLAAFSSTRADLIHGEETGEVNQSQVLQRRMFISS